MAARVRSRLPQIAVELTAKLDLIAKAGAEVVEAKAKGRAPVATGKLRDAIHVERKGLGEYAVIAGDDDVFYGNIVEHGSAKTPAHPFLIPAGEDSRGEIRALAAAALKRL